MTFTAAPRSETSSTEPRRRSRLPEDLAQVLGGQDHLGPHDGLEDHGPRPGRGVAHRVGDRHLVGERPRGPLPPGGPGEGHLDVLQRVPLQDAGLGRLARPRRGHLQGLARAGRGGPAPRRESANRKPVPRGERRDRDAGLAEDLLVLERPLEAPLALRGRAVRVSRRRTCGSPVRTSRWNSRFSRSATISRWSSPIPEMSSCPVSGFSPKRKLGSSSAMRASASRRSSRSPQAARLDGRGDDRLVGRDALEDQSVTRRGEGVPGPRVLEPHDGEDLAGPQRRHAPLLRGVHEQQPGDALLPALAGVPDLVPLGDAAGVDPEEDEAAQLVEERDLEGEGHERRVVVGGGRDRHVHAGGVEPVRGRHVERGGQPGADRVEDLRDALVAERRAAEEGDEPPGEGGPADRGAHERRAVEVRRPRGAPSAAAVVHVGERRQELAAGAPPPRGEMPSGHVEGARVVLVGEGTVRRATRSSSPAKLGAGAERPLHRRAAVVGEVAPHGAQGLLEVGPDPVHLVGEGDAGDPVAVGLPPDRLALRLDAVHGVEDHHGAVEDAQAPLHLDREVHVARGVDEVDLVAGPLEGAHRRGDGDARARAPGPSSPSRPAPSWTSPILWVRPAAKRKRSESVVFPASMWAMIPMLRMARIRRTGADSRVASPDMGGEYTHPGTAPDGLVGQM